MATEKNQQLNNSTFFPTWERKEACPSKDQGRRLRSNVSDGKLGHAPAANERRRAHWAWCPLADACTGTASLAGWAEAAQFPLGGGLDLNEFSTTLSAEVEIGCQSPSLQGLFYIITNFTDVP